MISLSQLKTVLDTKTHSLDVNLSSDDFFKIHRYLEGYIKRIMLIGLRLNGAQYENSRLIVQSTYINTANLIDKVIVLLDRSDKKYHLVISDLKKEYRDFFELKDLVLKFSAIYRNRLAHGTIGELNDQILIGYLCHIDRSFYKAFEQLLKNKHGHSAFDRPGLWGATQGMQETIEKTVKRLKLGSIVKDPLSLKQAIIKLEKTEYKEL